MVFRILVGCSLLLAASAAGYELCAGSGADDGIALWRPQVAGTGQALWALRTAPTAAPLIVETPHPFYDLDTLAEGRLFGLVHDGLWLHVGTPDAITEAEEALAAYRP